MKLFLGSGSSYGRYDKAEHIYNTHEKLSRTYVDGHKAIRLARFGCRNSYLYKVGDDLKLRLHNTDIATLHKDGTATLAVCGWETQTTRERLWRLAGVNVKNSTADKSVFNQRVWLADKDATVPFVDGIRYDTMTGEIVNPEIIPSDVSKPVDTVTKEGSKLFRKLWAAARVRLIAEINMGVTTSNLREKWKAPREYAPESIAAIARTLGEHDYDRLERAFLAEEYPWKYRNSGPGGEEITAELRAKVETFRRKLLWEYARAHGFATTISGLPLGAPYYTKGK